MALALALLIAFFDWTWFRPLVQQFVQHRSGRQVDFERLELGLDAALQPTVRVYKLSVENAPWAAAKALITAGEMGMTLSWRSLFTDPIIVTRLVLIDADLDLERQADGLRNWRLTRPNDRGPGRVRVLSVDAQRTRLRVVNLGAGLEMQLETAASARPRELAGRTALPLTRTVRLSGTRHGVAFEGAAEVSDVVTLFDTGQPFALRGQLQTASSRLQLEGVGSDVLGESTVDLRLNYSAERQDQMARVLGAAIPTTPLAATVTTRLQKTAGRWTLAGLQARLGGSDAAGDVVFEEHGATLEGTPGAGLDPAQRARNGVAGSLRSRRLDLRELRGAFAGSKSPPAEAGGSSSPAKVGAAASLPAQASRPASASSSAPASASASASASPLAPEAGASSPGRLALVDATLDWTLDEVLGLPRFPLSRVKAHIAVRRGRLTLAPLAFEVAGGRASGKLTLDSTHGPRELSAELDLKGLQVPALAGAGKRGEGAARQLAGTLDAQVAMASRGDSAQALAGAARGTLKATLVKGSVPASLDAQLGLDGGRWLSAKFNPDQRATITCSSLALAFADGRGQVQRLAMETDQVELTGSGWVDLPTRSLALTVAPQRKKAALFALDRWLQVRGPLADVKVSLVPPGASRPGPGCAAPAR